MILGKFLGVFGSVFEEKFLAFWGFSEGILEGFGGPLGQSFGGEFEGKSVGRGGRKKALWRGSRWKGEEGKTRALFSSPQIGAKKGEGPEKQRHLFLPRDEGEGPEKSKKGGGKLDKRYGKNFKKFMTFKYGLNGFSAVKKNSFFRGPALRMALWDLSFTGTGSKPSGSFFRGCPKCGGARLAVRDPKK